MNAGYEKVKDKLADKNKRETERAFKEYEEEGRVCKECSKLISYEKWKWGNIFCDHHCRAIFTNRNKKKKPKINKLRVSTVGNNMLIGVTKGQLFSRRKNWQAARSGIRQHAEIIFRQSILTPRCAVPECTYTNHIQIAHKRSVSSFPDDALITEINAPENLVGLCPNHHWDFDHDFLTL